MESFQESVVIARPVEEVFTFLATLENDAKWRKEWSDGHTTTEGSVDVGTTTSLVGSTLGVRVKAVYQVAEYEPNALVEWKTVKGPLPLTFQRAFVGVEGGTRVTFTYSSEPTGLLKLFFPLVKSMGNKALLADLPTLTELLDTDAK